ncbi:MAG: cell wall hydrolase [Alphaproteobacteria bacterium]|nr:cell wall hydrolase [Alphaproteobacteria bacterium]
MRRADRIMLGGVLLVVACAMALGFARAASNAELRARVATLFGPTEAGLVRTDRIVVKMGPRAPEFAAAAYLPSVSTITRAATASLDLEAGCLAMAVYFEARGETLDGQRAVAEVVLRRAKHPSFPRSVCGVVLEGRHRKTGCQFSFTCNGAMQRSKQLKIWSEALEVANYMMRGPGRGLNLTGRATHFHADYVSPGWAAQLVRTVQIGQHIFYRLPTASERRVIAGLDEAPRRELAALRP